MKCFKCGKVLERVFSDLEYQPYGATSFYSHGQYGSTVFDPMDESYLGIYICDECMVENAQDVVEWRPSRESVSDTGGVWTPPYKSASEWRSAHPDEESTH